MCIVCLFASSVYVCTICINNGCYDVPVVHCCYFYCYCYLFYEFFLLSLFYLDPSHSLPRNKATYNTVLELYLRNHFVSFRSCLLFGNAIRRAVLSLYYMWVAPGIPRYVTHVCDKRRVCNTHRSQSLHNEHTSYFCTRIGCGSG